MLKKAAFLTLGTLFAAMIAPAALAQDTTTAYVVHGIPGEDFGLDPALPVDIDVEGLGCAIPGFTFGDRVGPLNVPAGEYDITISLADEQEPCSGAAVISLENVPLAAGANSTIIAHRTADGSTGAGDLLELGITASLFSNDFSSTARGKARLIAHHTALAPTVEVAVSRDYFAPRAPGVTVPGFSNPTSDGDVVLSQINAEFRPGDWDVALEVDGANVFGPDTLTLNPFTAYYVYAVGDFFTGSFQYLIYSEEGLKSQDRGRRGAGAGDRVDGNRRYK
jgi:hypothetical protein